VGYVLTSLLRIKINKRIKTNLKDGGNSMYMGRGKVNEGGKYGNTEGSKGGGGEKENKTNLYREE
jgi:hypothetical protein